jgi:hypothetical protein
MDSYIQLTTYLMAHNDEDGSYSRFSVKLNACVPSRLRVRYSITHPAPTSFVLISTLDKKEDSFKSAGRQAARV